MPHAPILSTTALRVLAVTALSFSMLSACGKAEEAAQETATEAAIESMTDAAKLPDGFPADVRVPEGLVLETAMDVGGAMVVGGALPGDLATVASEIETHMKAASWTSRMAVAEPTMATQLWQDGKRNVSYVLEAKDGGGIDVVISYSVEAEAEAEAEAEPLSDITWPAGTTVESSAMRRDGAHVLRLGLAMDAAAADEGITAALERNGWRSMDRVVEGGLFQRTLERDGRRLDVGIEPTGERSARAELELAAAAP